MTGASFLVIAIGSAPATSKVAGDWVVAAEVVAPTRMVVLDSISTERNRIELDTALRSCRTGVRILVVGGQYDVLVALTAAREVGAVPTELSAFVVHTDDAPIYCVHCRSIFRGQAGPGQEIGCPHCDRTLEVHSHFAAALGSFLASDSLTSDAAVGEN